MWQQIRNNPRAALLAVLAHVIFIAVLLVSFNFSGDEPAGGRQHKPEAMRAEAVDEAKIEAERKQEAEKRRQQKLKEAERKKREARLREKKRLEQKKKQAAEKKRREAEKKRKLAEKKRREKALAEKKRKEALRKKREREKRLAEEKKRKLAEEKRREAERRRIEEEERRQQEELARQEAEMKQKLEAERQAAAARAAARQREIDKYLGLIKSAVSRHWIRPDTDVTGLSCKVNVRIIPNGDVIDVQIIESSGNLAFDRSVEKAVQRAAPLPVPAVESGLFDEFREVNFVFRR